jgi:long-chain acyl-CoA synthetase
MGDGSRAEQILEYSALRWPEHVAIIDRHGAYSYRQVQDAAADVARALRDSKVVAGAVVGISVSEARAFLPSIFGVLQAGCVAIPVPPHAPQAEQDRIVAETGVSWILHHRQDRVAPTLRLLGQTQLKISACGAMRTGTVIEQFPDAAVIRHTSGTTGKSKGVVLSHRAVQERTDASSRLLGVSRSDVVLAPLSLSYHFIASALSCLRVGATLVDCSDCTAEEMVKLGEAHGVTIVYAAPIQYEEMCRVTKEGRLPALTRAISTSALLPKSVAEYFFNRFLVRLTQVYGIIEVGLPLWNELESIEPSALGVCKSPYEAMIVDEQGIPVREGEIGELAIRGPGLFSGYLLGADAGAPSKREQCLLAGEWFLTGDLVTRDELGVIIYRGRKKSVINCGGNKIFPEEVEEVLQRFPEITAVRVSAEPHASLGSRVVAEVIIDKTMKASVESWRAVCEAELSGYKVPQEFRIVETLPITGSGKIVRHSM